jgi:hypothetical protein
MMEVVQRLEANLLETTQYVESAAMSDMERKPAEGKWSKKEIMGHLIDSAINNLKRFTEIQFLPKPYVVRSYNQVELVSVNHYQKADVYELVTCWAAINKRIAEVLRNMNEAVLFLPVVMPDGTKTDFRFLVLDYLDHMEHHIRQIKAEGNLVNGST